MPDSIVKIDQGELEGCVNKTEDGFEFKSYNGIPYIKPPLGNLRFQDPQPPEQWTGLRDATFEGPENSQKDLTFTLALSGSEDSITLNVHTPSDSTETSKLAVMVFVHGGGFRTGSGNKALYGGDRLVQKNVVLVTFNYRLGPLGFLCLNNKDIPGNAGLKDQIFALRWVQKNIAAFGGDPDNVTIFGESAGAASVQYLMMSPMGKGLFKRAIMQSGSCLSSWAVQKNPVQNAFDFAKDLGFVTTDLEELAKFLREVPVEDLINKSYVPFGASDSYLFLPTVETRIADVEFFLTNDPIDLMRSGRYNTVPCISGINSQEGIIFLNKNHIKVEDFSKLKDLSELNVDLKHLMKAIVPAANDRKINEYAKKINEHYFGSGGDFMEGYIDLLTEVHFLRDVDISLNLMKRHSVTYLYNFCYSGSFNLCRGLTDFPYAEASHADELGYIFKPYIQVPGFPLPEFTEEDRVVSERLTTMWTNFAKFDNPTPEINDVITETWKPITKTEVNCLIIRKDINMVKDPFGNRLKFWKDLFEESNTVKIKYDFNSKINFWKKMQKT